MVRWLLYLIESGICLTLLFGVYLVFFRKETYFGFIRLYLLLIMGLSLLIPLVYVSITLKDTSAIEGSVKEIGHFRNFYSRLVAMTDPAFADRNRNSVYDEWFTGEGNELQGSGLVNTQAENQSIPEISQTSDDKQGTVSWIFIIFIVYLFGITLFFFRLVSLLYGLFRAIKQNECIRYGNFTIVQLKEELPPFSFFRYVFINRDLYNTGDLEKILAHEKIHIRHLHSLDLLLAQGMCLLQWFNPLAWFLQKAIKTNHEYIADRQTVDRGFELFDYQYLLLSQLISIRSVELVNNFNLLSIKKRIAMMTKMKSGFAAKLKVLLVVPFAFLLFLLFADMTVFGPGKSFSNYVSLSRTNEIDKYQGVWENVSPGGYAPLIAFGTNTFSVLENELEVKEYKAILSDNTLFLDMGYGEKIPLACKYQHGEFEIWWSDTESSTYKKTDYKNSLPYVLGDIRKSITLPVISFIQPIDWRPKYFRLSYNGKMLKVGQQEGSLSDLNALLKKQKASLNKLELPKMTVLLYFDAGISMKDVYTVVEALRQNSFLKLMYMATPADKKESLLTAHLFGRPFKVPPLGGVEILSKEELKAKGIEIFTMNIADKDVSVDKAKTELKGFFNNSEKNITILEYDGNVVYSDFLQYNTMYFEALNNLRNEYAWKSYKTAYDDLSTSQQDEVRKLYPATLVLRNIDEEPVFLGK